jgi:DNA-binding NarL/FixJ family response regulator
MRCTVLIGDDHQVVLEGLRRILDRAGFQIVGEVSDGRALVEAAARLRPDVVVADITMPLLNGVEAARQIRACNRKVKIVFLTMHPEPMYAIAAIRAGGSGSGYVLKDSAGKELIAAIQEALRGRTYVTRSLAEPVMEALGSHRRRVGDESRRLTPRQREVLQLLAEGRSDKQLAAALRISVRTVEFHKSSIKQKLGLQSIAELARYAAKVGIVA